MGKNAGKKFPHIWSRSGKEDLISENYREIRKYGADVLESEDFAEAMEQTHHFHSTVGQHSLDVTFVALGISVLLARFFGVKVNARAIVVGCLCHDLGILKRERFRSGQDMCRRHPIESAEVAKKYAGDDAVVNDMCLHHMFPLMTTAPETTEGWIISVADKISSVGEVALPPVRRKWERRNDFAYAAARKSGEPESLPLEA